MTLLHPGLSKILFGLKPSIKALEFHRVSGARCYYGNLCLLVGYEKDRGLLCGTSKMLSGSVALLQINQVVGFIVAFLRSVHQRTEDDVAFSTAERIKVFMTTLGQHLSPLEQTSGKMTLFLTPGKQKLLKNFAACCHGDSSPMALLARVVDSVGAVYVRVEYLLSKIDS